MVVLPVRRARYILAKQYVLCIYVISYTQIYKIIHINDCLTISAKAPAVDRRHRAIHHHRAKP